VGLLKAEMEVLDSLIMKAARATCLEAGGALAVDRDLFSGYITKELKENPLINIIEEEVLQIPEGPTIIASGPLTSGSLHQAIKDFFGGSEYLYFFDAIAPIVLEDSIDFSKVYLKSRYDKGEAAYVNCPMTKEEFEKFYDFLLHAERHESEEFEMKVFEGCMPVEDMAKRGPQTLLFGPMKPVGLRHPVTGVTPYAVVQLRRDNLAHSMYNLVGFQTHLKWGEQKKMMTLIPGLENAEIVRYGVMHRNTYICSPLLLNVGYQTRKRPDLFFAGQMTGVEGYVESAASGLIAGINMTRFLEGKDLLPLDATTTLGALASYIVKADPNNFQPMNINYGIMESLGENVRKNNRKLMYKERALANIEQIKALL
jgi:methylenetetrahydrofolate--tRNA-(uracil-5-)-methyltransferase